MLFSVLSFTSTHAVAQTTSERWAPSEVQKTQALEAAGSFLSAVDEKRFDEAYRMLATPLKSIMNFEQFRSLQLETRGPGGGTPVRTGTRVTWYDNPATAQAPGVYAALDIACRFPESAICEEVVILHEQANGSFHVMRHERTVGR